MEYYIRLKDVLDLLPMDNICGPKPIYLREKISALPFICVDEKEHIIWTPTIQEQKGE